MGCDGLVHCKYLKTSCVADNIHPRAPTEYFQKTLGAGERDACLEYEQGPTAQRRLAVTEKRQAQAHTVLQPRRKRQCLALQTVLTVLTVLIGSWVGRFANCWRPLETTEEMERPPCLSPLQWNREKGRRPVPLHVG